MYLAADAWITANFRRTPLRLYLFYDERADSWRRLRGTSAYEPRWRQQAKQSRFRYLILPFGCCVANAATMLPGRVLFKNPKIFQKKEQSSRLFPLIKNTKWQFFTNNDLFYWGLAWHSTLVEWDWKGLYFLSNNNQVAFVPYLLPQSISCLGP